MSIACASEVVEPDAKQTEGLYLRHIIGYAGEHVNRPYGGERYILEYRKYCSSVYNVTVALSPARLDKKM